MILKAFKEKSNQKYINKTLSNRSVEVSLDKIKSVGVLLNDSEYCNYEDIEAFIDSLGIVSAKRSFYTFSKQNPENHNQWDAVYGPKDFGWNGKLKNIDLQNFTDTKFDVLICYFLAEENELKQIAAMSKANFKVGISNRDERLYDLIIEVKPKDFEIFKLELKKYLTILNKI
ncbi:DUF6913 domain-containing protein [Winogradskyella haliclonae]|uniref:Restriction endonuclease n=1 Tax=Winogradskyella haliclonae TaxID=2048558 RepID=A0ABQ2C2V9_9FLAO|nr:hypothetical protein [Winogradskyella haliclonae]GGI58408.1 hypothetical protein GCM10011444_27170 [Winogradskyella haliclonae]